MPQEFFGKATSNKSRHSMESLFSTCGDRSAAAVQHRNWRTDSCLPMLARICLKKEGARQAKGGLNCHTNSASSSMSISLRSTPFARRPLNRLMPFHFISLQLALQLTPSDYILPLSSHPHPTSQITPIPSHPANPHPVSHSSYPHWTPPQRMST